MNRLRNRGLDVIGLDNFNSHLYDPQLKRDRVKNFDLKVYNCDLRDDVKLEGLLRDFYPDTIVHLAAMAGVRDSLGKEKSYHANNIDATQNLIDICKKHLPNVRIVYASTSCVYAGSPVPWVEGKETGKQLNAYGYTKWANECQMQSSGLNTTVYVSSRSTDLGVDQTWRCSTSPRTSSRVIRSPSTTMVI